MDDGSGFSRVLRSKAQSRRWYTRLAPRYDMVEGWWERGPRDRGVATLDVARGEAVLEIGPGTGHALRSMALSTGPAGRVVGLDLARGMLRQCKRRLLGRALVDRSELVEGDAEGLPFRDGAFDAVFMSFTLELFDTPEIPGVLAECRRVLRPAGRLVVVALALPERRRPMVDLYRWAHDRAPGLIDCRPIPVATLVESAGFRIVSAEPVGLWGLSVAIVEAAFE